MDDVFGINFPVDVSRLPAPDVPAGYVHGPDKDGYYTIGVYVREPVVHAEGRANFVAYDLPCPEETA